MLAGKGIEIEPPFPFQFITGHVLPVYADGRDRPGNAPEMPEIQSGASLTGAGSGSGTSAGPQVGAGGTAISGGAALGNSGVRASTNASAQTVAGQDPVERLMTEARQLDAQGKRGEALKRYRQAAELLRQF